MLEHSSESTVAKWELAKDLRYKELWNKRHPALANPKSRNEGKVHRIRFISRARKAPSADHICFYVFTTLALSTHGNHWRLAQLSHGTSSRLPQPAVLSNVNWARPRSVSVPAYLNSKSDVVLQQSCPQPLAESPFRRGSESHPTPVSIPRPPRTLPIRS